MTAGVHLRRTDENLDEVDALADAHGGRVGLAGVLEVLDRQAEATRVPGLLVDHGFTWEPRDREDATWWPQGITNSAHTGVERRLLVTSWYSKTGRGSRITVVDAETLRYRHVLLAVPERGRLAPLDVHAGGVVWAGGYLHVAGTARGLFSCRLDDILEVDGEPVLPVLFQYAAAGDLRYSFLSVDRSTDRPHLVAGEYGRDAMTRRIVRYALDDDYRLSAVDGVATPVSLDDRGLGHMQGVAVVDGRYYVTTSRGRWRLGALRAGTPGAFTTYRQALPVGPEDLCYRGDEDRLWSLSEYPGERYVFSLEPPRA